MPLVACKCPGCGGDLDFDDSRDIMFCSYCGTKVMKEDITNITNNITIADGFQIHDADWYFNTIVELYKQERDAEANKFLDDFGNNFPLDSRLKELRELNREISYSSRVKIDTYSDCKYIWLGDQCSRRVYKDLSGNSTNVLSEIIMGEQKDLDTISEFRKIVESWAFSDKNMMMVMSNRRKKVLSIYYEAEELIKENLKDAQEAFERTRIKEERYKRKRKIERWIYRSKAAIPLVILLIDVWFIRNWDWDGQEAAAGYIIVIPLSCLFFFVLGKILDL